MKHIVKILAITYLLVVSTAYARNSVIKLNSKILSKLIKTNNLTLINSKKDITKTKHQINEVKSAVYPDINLESAYARLKNTSSSEKSNYSYEINLAQPLFTYGKVSNAVKIAKYYYANSENTYNNLYKNTLLKGLITLYSVKLFEKQQKIYQASKKSLKEHLENTKKRYELNDTTKLDFLTAQVNYSQIEPKLIEIQSKIENTKNELKKILNLDIQKTTLTITESLDVTNFKTYNYDKLLEAALKNDYIIQIYTKNIKIEKLTKKINKNTLRPGLNLIGTYGASSEKISNLYDKDNYYAGLSMTFPLFDGFESKSKVKQNQINIEKYNNELQKYKNELQTKIIEQLNNLKLYQNQIKANKLLIRNSEEALRVAKLRYNAGAETNTEVIDAEKDLVTAKSQMAVSNFNYIVTKLNLDNLIGTDISKL